MREIGRDAGRATGALISDMSQPLGRMVGNAIEIGEAVRTLRGERAGRFWELCLELTAHLATLAGVAADPRDGRERAERALASGAGVERFRALVAAQGGDPHVVDDLSLLPRADVCREVRAGRDGCVTTVDAWAIGRAAAGLGAGREREDDEIDPAVGIEMLVERGDRVQRDDVLARVRARDESAAQRAGDALLAAVELSDERADPPPLVHDVLMTDAAAARPEPQR